VSTKENLHVEEKIYSCIAIEMKEIRNLLYTAKKMEKGEFTVK
jgi:hypothetical protein